MSEFNLQINELSNKILQDKLSKMKERNDQRKAVEYKRRKERFEYGSQAEQSEVFSETFREHKRKIETDLDTASEAALSDENRSKLTIRLDNIFKIIDALKKYLTESSMFLSPFDNEQAKIEFQEIMNKFNNVRDSLLPKKKFVFNCKTKPVNQNLNSMKNKLETCKINNEPQTNFQTIEFGIVNESDKTLQLSGSDINCKDITLRNLKNCKVYLIGHPGSVYIHQINNCTIVCGPISRSIFIEDCQDSQFYFACQQGRIHKTENSVFYIHVTSRAIIEDCCGIRFAPYLLEYDHLDEDFKQSNLNIDCNNWDKVEDFKHLSADIASPNWSIISETDRQFLKI